MAEVLRMPRMSDTMEEGNLVAWLKKVGDKIEPGDVLAEVETDKATMELESYQEGVLLHIGVEKGPVPVNGVLAVIGQAGEDYKAALQAATAGAAPVAQPAPEAVETAPTSNGSSKITTPSNSAEAVPDAGDTRTKASPLARSLASEAGINLAQVAGSGDGGRIVKKDVEAFLQKGPAPVANGQSAAQTIHYASEGQFEDVPVSQMRKTIARRLTESKNGAPHFYLTVDIDMEAAMGARSRINELGNVKISFNDMVIKACAAALRKHPVINASWMGDAIRYNKEINIGVAVAVEDGLLVPVIRHADRKGMGEINTEVKALAEKAKERKLQPQEMQGNTFTISNLGMFGIEEFTAIINPPDACILAVGAIVEKAVVKNGAVVPGHRMKVTLSCDHRVVDGATGAQFLATLKSILEEPLRMLA